MICIKEKYGFTLNKYYEIIKKHIVYVTVIDDYGLIQDIVNNSSYFSTIEEYRNNQINKII